jgi:hypothetical protein
MKKVLRLIPVAIIAGLFAVATGSAQAATDTQTQTITCTISATATLVLGSSTVTFPNANPSTTPSVLQTESGASLDVTANARTSTNGAVTLTSETGGDLVDGGTDVIPITAVTWAGTGTGYNATGTLSKSSQQAVGSWTGPGTYAGTVNYSLANSWNYATGTYTATITYTLTAP